MCQGISFNISSHELGTRFIYCTVEDAFDGDEILIFSADITGVVDEISTNIPNSFFLYFEEIFFSNYSKVSGSANLGNFLILNKNIVSMSDFMCCSTNCDNMPISFFVLTIQ